MDLDENKDETMLDDTKTSGGVSFFVSIKQQGIPGLPPLPRCGSWNDVPDRESSSEDCER